MKNTLLQGITQLLQAAMEIRLHPVAGRGGSLPQRLSASIWYGTGKRDNLLVFIQSGHSQQFTRIAMAAVRSATSGQISACRLNQGSAGLHPPVDLVL